MYARIDWIEYVVRAFGKFSFMIFCGVLAVACCPWINSSSRMISQLQIILQNSNSNSNFMDFLHIKLFIYPSLSIFALIAV